MNVAYREGEYIGAITEQKLIASGENQTPAIAIKFDVIGRPDPSVPDGAQYYEPHHVHNQTAFIYLTEKTKDFATRDMERLGFFDQGDFDFSRVDDSSPNCISLIGERRNFFCKHDLYDGKTTLKWSVSSGGGLKTLEDDGLSKLNNLFGTDLRNRAKMKAAQRQNAQSSQTPPPQSDPGVTPALAEAMANKAPQTDDPDDF